MAILSVLISDSRVALYKLEAPHLRGQEVPSIQSGNQSGNRRGLLGRTVRHLVRGSEMSASEGRIQPVDATPSLLI
jgi:hypothetical protein